MSQRRTVAVVAAGSAAAVILWWRWRNRHRRGRVGGVDVYVVPAASADDEVHRLGAPGILGLDVEWPPDKPPRAAVVQIASARAVVIIQAAPGSQLPPKTKALLMRSACAGARPRPFPGVGVFQ